jgi:uncharacterized membrane protein YsdA (DUF1294 family)
MKHQVKINKEKRRHYQLFVALFSSLFLSTYLFLNTPFFIASTSSLTSSPTALIKSTATIIVLFCWIARNVYTFLLFGLDKYRAVTHKFRISEKELIQASSFCGWFGGILGMILFLHKYKKMPFVVSIAEKAVVDFICIIVVLLLIPTITTSNN